MVTSHYANLARLMNLLRDSLRMKYRLSVSILAALTLSACALWPGSRGLGVNVVQDSDYCGTRTPQAELHYFASPDPFAAWITEREIDGLRASAASLTGVFVVELGQRPSAGYSIKAINGASHIEGDTLYLAMRWSGPGLDSNVSPEVLSPCVVIPRPKGNYDKVVLVDQRNKPRAQVALP